MRLIRALICWPLSALLYRSTDILIAGFPKTGTTYLKSIIASLLQGSQDMSVDEINEYAHEYGNWSVLKRPLDRRRKIIKTHRERNLFHIKHEKIIVTYRDPIENLISFYIYHRARRLVDASETIVVFEEKTRFFRSHKNFYSKWNGDLILFEDLGNADVLAMKLIGIFPEFPRKLIVETVQLFTVEKMKTKQTESFDFKRKFAKGFTFAGDSKFKQEIRETISDLDLATLTSKKNTVYGK